jgi:hypothetical protein
MEPTLAGPSDSERVSDEDAYDPSVRFETTPDGEISVSASDDGRWFPLKDHEAFNALMDEANYADCYDIRRGNELRRVAAIVSERTWRGHVARAASYHRRRLNCRALPVRAPRGRSSHRIVVRSASKPSATADPDSSSEPPGRRALRSGGAL